MVRSSKRPDSDRDGDGTERMAASEPSLIGRAILLLIGICLIGMALLGAVWAVIDSGMDRLIAVGMMVLCGGLGGTVLLIHFCPSSNDEFEHRTIEHDGQHREALVAPVSRTKHILVLGVFAAVGGFGVVSVVIPIAFVTSSDATPGIVWFASWTLIGFGLWGLWILKKLNLLLRKPKDLALLSDGIRLPSIAGGKFVPWRAIEFPYLTESPYHPMYGIGEIQQTHLRINIRNRSAIERSTWDKFVWSISFTDYHIMIPLRFVGVSGAELKEVISRFSRLADERLRLEYIQRHLETVQDDIETDRNDRPTQIYWL